MELIHMFLHLDQTLITLSQTFGVWLYVILFLIVFAETGLVVTPFLPGDSLLFAVGALSALPESGLNPLLIIPLLITAALLGDNTNYWIGRKVGPRIFSKTDSRWFNKKHLDKTQSFYDKYGSRAVVFGRFMPIARTFVPFVAGIGQMPYQKFIGYSILSALIWVNGFILAGFYFGNLPSVKTNFHVVIVAVILVSLLPMVIEAYKARRKRI
jgi:membrane-associated protein